MKKFFVVVSVLFVLFTFTACNVGAGEFEPTNQLAKNGRIVSVCGEQVEVNVNGEPTNPWVWWVIDCKPLK